MTRFETTLIAARNWTALIGAFVLVGFLTFVPQRSFAPDAPSPSVRHQSETEWPSRTAAFAADSR